MWAMTDPMVFNAALLSIELCSASSLDLPFILYIFSIVRLLGSCRFSQAQQNY